jgi:hypothetical protein
MMINEQKPKTDTATSGHNSIYMIAQSEDLPGGLRKTTTQENLSRQLISCSRSKS